MITYTTAFGAWNILGLLFILWSAIVTVGGVFYTITWLYRVWRDKRVNASLYRAQRYISR